MFWFGYYYHPAYRIHRILLGPFFIFLGILFSLLNYNQVSDILCWISVISGILYIFFPLLLRLRHNSDGSDGTISIKDPFLVVKNNPGEAKINKDRLINIFIRRNYLFLYANLSRKVYLIFNLSKIENSDQFVSGIKNLLTDETDKLLLELKN